MIFHCLAVPYVKTSKEISLCAFTQKVYKFCKEMTKRGHTIFHYGHEKSEVICSEHITCTNDDIIQETYSSRNWKKEGFDQNVNNLAFKHFNESVIQEIKKRKQGKNEFLMCWFGYGHAQAADSFKNEMFIAEPSIGYDSMFAPIKIFETYAQMHKMHGKNHIDGNNTGVISPGFYQEDFTFKSKKENYGLFLGRIIEEKGAKIAYDLANFLKREIQFAGPNIMGLEETEYCKFIGFVDPEKRKELLSNAAFMIAPSLFSEPCNWSVIESQFSGTPCVTTDFGGFAETNVDGITGYRCSTAKDFVQAIHKIPFIKPEDCYANAVNKYLIQTQCDNYEKFFSRYL